MATEVEIDTILNSDRSEQGLSQLRKGLKDLVSLQSQVGTGSVHFNKLQKAINETEGRISDLNDSFQTLRGSGVERLNSSIGLLREGFLNADPGKLSIGMQGLGSAMKALPIFLIVTAITTLISKFNELKGAGGFIGDMLGFVGKGLDMVVQKIKNFTDSIGATNFRLQEMNDLLHINFEINTKANLEAIEREISLRRAMGKNVLDLEISKREAIKRTAELEISGLQRIVDAGGTLTGDAAKRYAELNSIVKNANNEIEVLTIENQNKLTAKEKEESQKRIAAFQEMMKKRQEDEEYYANKRLELDQQEAAAELEIAKKTVQDNKDFKAATAQAEAQLAQQQADVEEAKRRLRLENNIAWEKAFQKKTFSDKISAIEQERDTLLLNEQLTQDQRVAIIEKAENDIFQLKVKKAQEYVYYAQQATALLAEINTIQTNNENYALNQQKYQKDAAVLNDQYRTQEALDREELKKNQLLNNDRLTSQQRERIAYESETRQRNISKQSKENQDKLNRDFAKKEIELKRKQFERQKALQIATGIVNTAAAVLQTLASVPYPASIPLAIATGVIGAAQVAVIASQKFDDGGTGAMGAVQAPEAIDTRGGFSSSGSEPTSQQPRNFDPSGTGIRNGGSNSNGITRVVVLESDIRKVQSKVDVIEDRAVFAD